MTLRPRDRGELTRRTVLKLLGGTAAGASMPWLWSPSARGQADAPPLRVLFVEAGPGVRRGTFEPAVAGPRFVARTTAETSWTLRDVMNSLSPYRERITMFDNLDMVSQHEDPSSPANAHIDGLTHMLTADSRHQGSGDLGTGPSIDQRIAQHVAASGPVTRLASLEVQANDSAGTYSRTHLHDSYSAPGQKVPFLTYIPDIWDRLFPEPLPAGDAQAAARTARRTSIHDLVRGDYDRLVARLGGEDRAKLEQMRDYHADLQAGLSVVSSRDQNRPLQSSILDPWSMLDEGYQRGNLQNRTWKVHCELIAKLVAAAFHTDTTRVANFSIDTPPAYEFGYTAGNFGTTDWHDLDHKVSGDEPQLDDAAAAAVIDEMHRVAYSQVRFLLDELAGLQETDGQSLLDHTLVVVYSHIAEGSHDVTRLPWMVIGDAHGYLRTGQYIRFPITATNGGQVLTDFDGSRIYSARGRAHGDLFATIANAVGLSIPRFGNGALAESHGVIDEMLA